MRYINVILLIILFVMASCESKKINVVEYNSRTLVVDRLSVKPEQFINSPECNIVYLKDIDSKEIVPFVSRNKSELIVKVGDTLSNSSYNKNFLIKDSDTVYYFYSLSVNTSAKIINTKNK